MKSKVTLLISAALLATLTVGASTDPRRLDVIGLFINDDSRELQIDLVSSDGKDITNLTLSSNQIDTAAMMNGEIRVYVSTQRLSDRRLLSICRMPSPESAPKFFDRKDRRFYFRIAKGKAILVKPVDLTIRERKLLEGYRLQLRRATESR